MIRMTEFQKKWSERKKQWDEAEHNRTGDIYAECVKRGCDKRFLEMFDTRIWFYPVEQTNAFLAVRNDEDCIRQWKVYLQVVIEKRPNHEMSNKWKIALGLLE